jgi:hypothetical protein
MVSSIMDCWIEGGGKNVGAMVWRRHEPDPRHPPAPHGATCCRPLPHLGVMTAAGLACLDCPASDPPHGHWTWTGEPPNVTATPSLNVNHEEWHGYLANGELVP